jgi:DNA-binding GntR family transcriptional regulator
MAYEYTPPKYAQVIAELQRRIDSGEYPPGSLLPSENQLSGEFAIARPTVVRALRVLRQEGWINTQQGKGSFVRGRPALSGSATERPGQVELDRDESRDQGTLISASPAPAPARIAALLGIAPETDVLCRRRLLRQDGVPSEIVTWWLPMALAQEAGLDGPEPVRGSVRSVVERAAGTRIDHVAEQILARQAAPHELKLLDLSESAPVLALYLSVRDAAGRPLLAIDLAMVGDLHELEDAYPVG